MRELVKNIAAGVFVNKVQADKFDFKELKSNLTSYISRLAVIQTQNYQIIFDRHNKNVEKFYQVNRAFIESSEVSEFYITINMLYKYLLYHEWIDDNLELVW